MISFDIISKVEAIFRNVKFRWLNDGELAVFVLIAFVGGVMDAFVSCLFW